MTFAPPYENDRPDHCYTTVHQFKSKSMSLNHSQSRGVHCQPGPRLRSRQNFNGCGSHVIVHSPGPHLHSRQNFDGYGSERNDSLSGPYLTSRIKRNERFDSYGFVVLSVPKRNARPPSTLPSAAAKDKETASVPLTRQGPIGPMATASYGRDLVISEITQHTCLHVIRTHLSLHTIT